MFEYEYRLSVRCDDYNAVLNKLIEKFDVTDIRRYSVYYIRPHFRFKHGMLEWKQPLSNVTLYHDGLWFKLMESEEIAFSGWSKHLNSKFIENAGQYSNPFVVEYRTELTFPYHPRVKVYGFRKDKIAGLVFELEWIDSNERWTDLKRACIENGTRSLDHARDIYKYFRDKQPMSSYVLTDCTRKPVIPIDGLKKKDTTLNLLGAQKYDGVFGFVQSYSDEIREMWEDNKFRLRRGETLGDGFVFGAERMPDKNVILLDVYQVRGSPVVSTKELLLDFLPRLEGKYPRYKIQKYHEVNEQRPEVIVMTDSNDRKKHFDGFILHDMNSDTIYKMKSEHTVDLVHFDGYYLFPKNQKKKVPVDSLLPLKDGAVYECSLQKLKPLKERKDRFVGNTAEQIRNIDRVSKRRKIESE